MTSTMNPDTSEKAGPATRQVVAGHFLSLDGVAEDADQFITAWDDETDAKGAELIATQDAVVATSTARLGSIGLLGGIVKLDGVEVVTKVTSNLAKGSVVNRKVTIGAMSIAGNKFGLTGDGVEAMGKTNPIPGLPDNAAQALAALGITITPGKATVTFSDAMMSVRPSNRTLRAMHSHKS